MLGGWWRKQFYLMLQAILMLNCTWSWWDLSNRWRQQIIFYNNRISAHTHICIYTQIVRCWLSLYVSSDLISMSSDRISTLSDVKKDCPMLYHLTNGTLMSYMIYCWDHCLIDYAWPCFMLCDFQHLIKIIWCWIFP